VAFSRDGTTVITGSHDNTARLWDASKGRPRGEAMTHQGPVNAVAFRPDGKTILTGGFRAVASEEIGHDRRYRRVMRKAKSAVVKATA
jgi:WD40 repeat protein